MRKFYGWKKDKVDVRDFKFKVPRHVNLAALPTAVDLRSQCPAVYDQGELGSCTANAIAAAIEFEQVRQRLPDFMPSRLFIYFNERDIEGTTDSDSGAEIRDGIKSVNSLGVCEENLWQYDVSQFAVKPPDLAYQSAKHHEAVQYERLSNSLTDLKGCLASGLPFVCGISVYDSFESDAVAANGVVPLPQPKESLQGGHAILIVGYDDSKGVFICRNSWGADWGMNGYFTLPYAYLTNADLASDFWVIQLLTAA